MLVHSFASMTTMAQQSEMQWPANALTSEWTIKQDRVTTAWLRVLPQHTQEHT